MSGKSIVIHKLLASPGVTALVGQQIWPNKAPQKKTKPFILVSGPGQENRQLLQNDAGYPRSRIRVEAVAATAAAAETIMKAAFDALKNITNAIITDGGSPAEFVAIATIIPTDFRSDGYSDIRDADVEIMDFYVDWRSG